MPSVQQFRDTEFLSLETFRKSGAGVRTPIWFVDIDGDFLLWTDVNSGKVKRIRNNPSVRIAPCGRRGEVTGEWVTATASIDESPELIARVEKLMLRRVGLLFLVFKLIDKVRDRRNGGRRICLRVTV